jgi:hypothetical protein
VKDEADEAGDHGNAQPAVKQEFDEEPQWYYWYREP